MKKTMMDFTYYALCFLAAIFFFGVAVFAALGLKATLGNHSEHYATSAVVTAIDRAGDTVICEDYNGFLWVFEGADDWSIGDGVSLVMDDNGTPSIFDDIIISTRYTAWNFSK